MALYRVFNQESIESDPIDFAGHFDDARIILERQIQTNVYDEDLVLILIQTCIQLGRKEEALTWAQKMLSTSPDNPQWKSLKQEAEALSEQ